jgi:hypothetical protein
MKMNSRKRTSTSQLWLHDLRNSRPNVPRKPNKKRVQSYHIFASQTHHIRAYSELIITSFVEYRDQLLAFGVTPGAPGSETQALAILKADLDAEMATWVMDQVEANTLSRVVCDLKVSTDKFATQIPTLEDKVKHLEDKVVEGLKEVRAWDSA